MAALIELVDGDFVQCVWLADAEGMDFLGCCYRHKGRWFLRYRFRYHSPKSRDPFDEHDEKNWYRAYVPEELADAAAISKCVAGGDFAFGALPNFRRIDVCGDQSALLAVLSKESRTYMRVEAPANGPSRA